MKRLIFAVVALAVVALGLPPARAQVLGTTAEGNGGFGLGYSFSAETNLVIGQSFALDTSTPIASITVYVNGDGTAAPQDQFTLTLTNNIGSSATAANVLYTGIGTFPNSLGGEHGPVTFLPNLTLGSGTYYIVLSSDGGPGTGWGTGGDLLPTTLGSVGSSYVGITSSVGTYQDLDTSNPNSSRANFLVTAVPEPAGLSLIALVGVPLLKRRRRAGH